MSGDPEQEYFADGMAEDIITGLSRIKWLLVIARNSSFLYKGRAVDVKHVGRELGVRYILEGSLRKAANRVRLTGQLIDATTGSHVWADRYDRPLDDIFAVQDEITLSVVGAIEPTLRKAEVERIKRKRPGSLDAYDLVLLAAPHINPGMIERTTDAISLLERALAIEPEYAVAHGHMADAHQVLFFQAGMRNENREAAVRHANEAMRLGRDDATALTLAGFVIGKITHEIEIARHAFETALALSPSSAMTYGHGSVVMAWAGDAERAVEWAERALRLNPGEPFRFAPMGVIALARFLQERFDESAAAARKAIQANPKFSTAHMLLTAPLVRLDRLDEARQAASRLLSLEPQFSIGSKVGALSLSSFVTKRMSEALRAAGLPE
jgi:TolB-like protein/Flp pilus assembly protein TadD